MQNKSPGARDTAVARDGGIYLRPMLESDIDERYLSWFRDEEVTRYLESKYITADDALAFLRWGQQTNRRFMYAVCLEDGDLHIGNVKIGDIQPRAMLCDLVTVLGDRNHWGKGYATAAIKLATALAFDVYGIRKLNAGIYSGNIGSLKAYTRAGWLVEAVLYAQYAIAGGFQDKFVISCFNPGHHSVLPSFPLTLPQI